MTFALVPVTADSRITMLLSDDCVSLSGWRGRLNMGWIILECRFWLQAFETVTELVPALHLD